MHMPPNNPFERSRDELSVSFMLWRERRTPGALDGTRGGHAVSRSYR
jgi:hypothetical protein